MAIPILAPKNKAENDKIKRPILPSLAHLMDNSPPREFIIFAKLASYQSSSSACSL
jgi:hypothetical protein